MNSGWKKSSLGFAIGPVLAVIAMIAIAGGSVLKMTSKTARGERIFQNQAEVMNQSRYIGNRLRQCVILYPAGNNGTGFNVKYPGATVAMAVSSLTCPGQPNPNNLWTGKGGTFPPRPIAGFSNWTYQNDASGVRIMLSSGGIQDNMTVLQNVASKFSATEAAYSGGVLTVFITN